MDIKAVIFDVDGTLYVNDEKRVLSSTEEALQQLKRKGIKLAICTSRCPEEFVHFPKEIIEMMDLMIYAGGAKITEGDRIVYQNTIDLADTKHVIDYLNEQKIVCRYSTTENTGYFSKYRSKEVDEAFYTLYEMMPTEKEYEGEACINLVFYLKTEQQLSDIYHIARNSTVLPIGFPTEITALHVSKLSGVAEACKHWGISIENVMAFGDGGNDIEMLGGVGYGIAMGNAGESVKTVAKYITDDYKHDGIYKALVKHNLISED